MHQWMVLSGLSDSEILSGRFEENLKILQIDESNLMESPRRLELAFLNDAERALDFLTCISK